MPTIAIIAPSGYAPDSTHIPRAVERLQTLGWKVKNLVDPTVKYQRFSANDTARLAQIYQAAEDPEVDVVLAMRGGYGLSRLVEKIDFVRLAATRKLFVGYSDFTILQLGLLAKTGAISFAGPVAYGDFGSAEFDEFSFQHFQQCLTRSDYEFTAEVKGNPQLQVEGIWWGGNLSIVTHLIGSAFFPTISNGILFVEEVNENPYRIERMLLQLHHAGVLKQQKALVLGHFTQYTASEYDNGYDLNVMLAFLRKQIPTPILTGLPFGHCPKKVMLPIGAQASLKSDAHSLVVQFRGYPHLNTP